VWFILVFVSPNSGQELVVGENPSGVLHKLKEQAVFSRAQLDQLSFHPNFTPVEVNLQTVINLDWAMSAYTG